MAFKNLIKYKRSAQGLSLIELIIVLGISSMLVGGSFAWMESRKSTDFYDQVRQIESQIREVQSQIVNSELPGFNAGCNTADRVGCPIGLNEQVFATAVTADSTSGNEHQLTFQYIKAEYNPDTGKIITSSPAISAFGARQVDLVETMKYAGGRIVGTGSCAADYSNWTRLNPVAGESSISGANTVTFRNEPLLLNYYSGSGVAGDYLAWGGEDPEATLNAGGTIASIPCAVMWLFESEEQLGGQPRFTAEIVFDLKNRVIRLQTR